MALKTHPKGSKGVYEDNLPRVTGVKVEVRKNKGYEFFWKRKDKDTRMN
jgi:hypothetical protein